jgi:ATP-dependent DNA helicase RecG
MAILMALESGKQACLIAPTEILARQHYETIKNLLLATKYKDSIYLLTGSMSKADKNEVKNHINNKDGICLIGTHALLQKDINWQNLGLVVVDEQHRFGVNQRQSLHTSSKYVPHTLCLTATPIPRSLALTVYGELDISILDKPPATKAGYSTSLVSPNSTTQMYDKIKKSLDAGRQAYIVCPLVEDSEILNVKSAEQTYKELSQSELKGYKIGLVHGRLKPKDKERVMADFKAGNIDILVATTVIEVGVDVPNATDMVVLSAERFGLAQLHQLRGRVGRGAHKGHCYLVMTDSDRPSARMRVLESTNDGFKLAQYDLDLRGPGAIYGTRQHGELDLRFVNLADTKLIATVKQAVLQNVQNQQIMLKYPKVADRLQKTLQLTYLN